jgi:Spy/CpxP family protein refolding chaperone
MRTFGKMALACGLVALLVAPAHAQRPGGGRGGFGGFGGGGGGAAMILANKGVQQELKASDEQAKKLNALAEEIGEKNRGVFAKLQDLSQDERRAKMAEIARDTNTEVRKNLAEILKPEQVKRFEQIQLQQMGLMAAPDMPRVQETLKLTDDQKAKLAALQTEQREAMRELFSGGGGGDRQAVGEKMAELRKKSSEKALAVLTDAQKSSWKELTGEPFEVRFEPQRRPNP